MHNFNIFSKCISNQYKQTVLKAEKEHNCGIKREQTEERKTEYLL